MHLVLAKILIGFTVGTLIGLTGLGGGVLLLPTLIFGLHVPAIIALGSDALFNFFTKIPASAVHLWRRTVRRKVVLAMAVGSIPASLAAGAFLPHLRVLHGDGVNDFIKSAIALLLVCSYAPEVMIESGSGHAVIFTGVTSFQPSRLGTVDYPLVDTLLSGAIPGGLVGSCLSTRVPVLWLRRILCAVLLTTGAKML